MNFSIHHFVKSSIFLVACLFLGALTQAQAEDSDELKNLWDSLEFKKKFLRTYGTATDIEPKFELDEQEFYAGIREIIFDNPSEAIQKLEDYINESSSAIMYFTLGALNFQEGNAEQAIKNYKKAIEKFPDYRRAHRNLGILYSQEGEYQKSIKSLTKTIQLGDADPLVYGLLGVGYAAMNQHLAAESSFRIAIISEPESIDWQLGLVRSYLAQEKFNDAQKLLESLMETSPDSEKLWSLHANILVQQEKFEDALVNIELLRDQGKASSKLLYLLGDLYLNDEYEELALEAYKQAMDDAENANTSRVLRAAKTYSSLGSYNSAKELIKKLKLASQSELSDQDQLEILRIEAKMAIATDEGAAAIDLINQILEKDPLDGEALIMAGDYYSLEGDNEKAMFRYESAAKVEGFEASGLVKQAQLYVQKSDYKQAITLLTKAQQIDFRDNIQRYLESVERLARAASS